MQIDEKETKKVEELASKTQAVQKTADDLLEQIGKIKGHTNQKVKDAESRLPALERDLEAAKRNNEEVQKQMENYAKPSGANEPKELYKISDTSGNDLKITWFIANHLVKQMMLYFSFLDNPFDRNFSDQEKDKLIASISGNKGAIPQSDVDTSNRAIDPNWEWKEPGKVQGIVEPIYGSFEWYKRWWAFHSHFADLELSYGTEEDYREFPSLVQTPIDMHGRRTLQHMRDVVAFKEQLKQEKLARANEYLGPQGKLQYLTIVNYMGPDAHDYSAGVTEIEYDDCYTGDFLNFILNETFKQSTLEDNLLLIKGKYGLSPDSWAWENAYNRLHVNYFKPKNSSSTSNLLRDHDLQGIPDDGTNEFVNYLRISKTNPPYRFDKVKKGFRGMLEVAYDVFDKGNLKEEFFTREDRISLGTSIGQAEYFANSNLNSNLQKVIGKKLGIYQNTSSIEAEIIKLKTAIETANLLKEDDAKLQRLEVEYRAAVLKHAELRKELEKRQGGSRKQLEDIINGTYVPYFNSEIDSDGKVKNSNSGKRSREFFTSFETFYNALRKINESDSGSFTSDQTEAWTKYGKMRDAINQTTHLTAFWQDYWKNRKLKEEKVATYLERWLKEKEENRRSAEIISKELDGLYEIIILGPDEVELRSELEKAEFIKRDLRSYLRVILKEIAKTKPEKIQEKYTEWNATSYGKDKEFYNLVHSYVDHANFKKFLNEVINKGEDFSQWIADEEPNEVIKGIRRYEIYQWMTLTESDRRARSNEQSQMLRKFIEYIELSGGREDLITPVYQTSSFPGQGASDWTKEYNQLKSIISKELENALGKPSASKVLEWTKSNWNKPTEVQKITANAKARADEFKAYAKSDLNTLIKEKTPNEVVTTLRWFEIEKIEGITIANIATNKGRSGKEKLERVMNFLQEIETFGKAADRTKATTMKTAVSSRLAEIAKENAKAVTDGKDKVTSTTDGKDKVTSTTDGAKATELKWYERAYYWPVWSAFIVLGAGGLTWWYWDKISGKKPEGEGVEGE